MISPHNLSLPILGLWLRCYEVGRLLPEIWPDASPRDMELAASLSDALPPAVNERSINESNLAVKSGFRLKMGVAGAGKREGFTIGLTTRDALACCGLAYFCDANIGELRRRHDGLCVLRGGGK